MPTMSEVALLIKKARTALKEGRKVSAALTSFGHLVPISEIATKDEGQTIRLVSAASSDLGFVKDAEIFVPLTSLEAISITSAKSMETSPEALDE